MSSTTEDEKYMQRCLTLAQKAFGNTYPNPMVGSVLVCNGEIIGEGYHHKAGEPHAEVNAINSVKNEDLLQQSTLYVNLEPCSHYGKTPPCADLIIAKKIPHVVVGCVDSFSKVQGKGIEKMRNAGVGVDVGVLENEARSLNKRFFTYNEKHRPYIVLKWAQSADKYIDKLPKAKPSNKGVRITDETCQTLVHEWRSQELAILVGTQTAVNDNPSLTTRLVDGKNPLRVAWDLHNRIPESSCLKDRSTPTIIFTSNPLNVSVENLEYVLASPNTLVSQTIEVLYQKGIQSLIVEGGTKTLQTFIDMTLWDEARIFTTTETFGDGIAAPTAIGKPWYEQHVGNALLQTIFR